jgi:WD40 repeat protein
LVRELEGHTDAVVSIDFLPNTNLLATKGRSRDSTVRIWHPTTGTCLATFSEAAGLNWMANLAFHPHRCLLATVGSDPGLLEAERDRVIHIWELDLANLLGLAAEPSAHYVNAKVVLVGDTGVGKSGLSLVLNNQPFEATDSTPGRRVWTFGSQEVEVGSNVKQTRETLLWDLAG